MILNIFTFITQKQEKKEDSLSETKAPINTSESLHCVFSSPDALQGVDKESRSLAFEVMDTPPPTNRKRCRRSGDFQPLSRPTSFLDSDPFFDVPDFSGILGSDKEVVPDNFFISEEEDVESGIEEPDKLVFSSATQYITALPGTQ